MYAFPVTLPALKDRRIPRPTPSGALIMLTLLAVLIGAPSAVLAVLQLRDRWFRT